MVSDRLDRSHLPAAILLGVGLALAVFAGITMYDYSQEKYRYEVSDLDGDDEGVFIYVELSDEARHAIDAALSSPANETIVEGNLGPELGSDGRYLLRYQGDYHCLSTDDDIRSGIEVNIETDCGWLPSSGPPVHAFQNLSDDGKTKFRTAFRDADRTVWLQGDTPPEFRSGQDEPGPNDGNYLIRYQGNVYRFIVASGGLVGFGLQYAFGAGITGMLLAAIGAHSSQRGLVRRPTAILVLLAVVFGPFLLPIADPGVPEFFTRLLPAGVLASLGVWGLLVWLGVD